MGKSGWLQIQIYVFIYPDLFIIYPDFYVFNEKLNLFSMIN